MPFGAVIPSLAASLMWWRNTLMAMQRALWAAYSSLRSLHFRAGAETLRGGEDGPFLKSNIGLDNIVYGLAI